MIRVLFVCLGNICRSPMAEAVFQHLVNEAGLEGSIEVDSAGTAGWVDSPAHAGTLDLLTRNGIEYSGLGRNIVSEDLDEFDYVITMDDQNLRDVKTLGVGSALIAPLMSFAAGSNTRDVPDPYFDNRFEAVYTLVRAGAAGLLEHIRKEHGL